MKSIPLISAVIAGILVLSVLVSQVRCDFDDDRDHEYGHRVLRRSSPKTPTSLIELLMGIFDTFYVTAKREERKIRQRHAIYPQLRSREDDPLPYHPSRYY